MATTEGLDTRAPSPATAAGDNELRAVLATTLGPSGPLLAKPVMEAGVLGALAGGMAGAAVASGVRALLERPGGLRLWILLAAGVGALAAATVAMRRWRGVALYLPKAPRRARDLSVGTWVAVAGERRPWQRLVEVVELEQLGGPYDLVRVVLGNGSDATVAGSCPVPVGTLAPPPSLLSWPRPGAAGTGR